MNPFSGVSWFWRAWRGQSVTFAALFATGVLGISVLGALRHFLSRIGLPWYLWLIAPFVVVSLFARKEQEWLPDPDLRRRCARWLVIGSIAGALLIARFLPAPAAEPAERKPSEPVGRAGVRHP